MATAALVCSAVLFYFGTGLTPVAALAWLAPLPVLLVAPRVSGWTAAGLAFLACLLGATNSWSWYAHSHDVPLLPFGLLISVGFALTLSLAVAVWRRLLQRGHVLLAMTGAPAVWVGVVYLVAITNPMGVQGTMATTQADVPLVLQVAAVTGAWGIEYLVLLAPAAVAAVTAPGVSTTARIRAGIVATTVLLLTLGAGATRLITADPTGPPLRIALLASNEKGWAADVDTPAGRNLVAAYAARIAALPNGVSTVVLPEAAFGAHVPNPPALFTPMSEVARARGVDVVLGFAQWDGTTKYNFALIFGAAGGEPVRYLKQHDTVSPAGHDLTFTPAAGARIGVEICMDVNFRDPSQDYAAAGTQLLVIPASDEDVSGWQHSRTALLRGVENGIAVAWSGRQTTLMASDGLGRILASTPTGGPDPFTTVIVDVPPGLGATPYTHLGDWFAWLCLILSAAAAGRAGWHRARPNE
jgi:apolipoprotein N-acyltransferase